MLGGPVGLSDQATRSSDAEHVPRLVAALRAFSGTWTWRRSLLVLTNQGEEAAEPLVLQDCRRCDAPQLVEGAVGQPTLNMCLV
jgi:hypothetical protein